LLNANLFTLIVIAQVIVAVVNGKNSVSSWADVVERETSGCIGLYKVIRLSCQQVFCRGGVGLFGKSQQ
jgi:hypothetical protein